jgi:hypothetical protein
MVFIVHRKYMKKKYYNQGNKTKNNTFHFSLPTFH